MAVTFPRLNPVIFKEQPGSPFELVNDRYYQKWNPEDYIVFQVAYDGVVFTSGEVVARLVDGQGVFVADCSADVVAIPGGFQSVFRCSCGVPDGIYRILLTTASGKFTYYSNFFEVGRHEHTMLVKYLCKQNRFDCIFNTEEYLYCFFFRVEGDVKSADIAYHADDVFYVSQDRRTYLLDSVPYSVRKYTFGDASGFPVWMADRLNRIMACEEVSIDGVAVVKNDGARFEPVSSDAYPYVGLKIELLHRDEGDSEVLYAGEEAMQSGVGLELADRSNSFSAAGERTGRIHVSTFEKVFN